MKISIKTIAFVGAIALVPAFAFAQAKTSPKTAAKTAAMAPAKAAATHATNGVVKSSDAASLVITKSAKDMKTTTFTVNAATVTKGTIAPGAHVSVRYRTEGTENIATAVTVAGKKTSPKSGK